MFFEKIIRKAPDIFLLNQLAQLGISVGAAHSLRRLGNYRGPLIRVRRSSDNTERDIGYEYFGIVDRAGLRAFCGTSSGFIVTVYDPSGNGLHATQTVAARQPRIVNAGVIEVDPQNGLPCAVFDGVDDWLATTYNLTRTTIQNLNIFMAYRATNPSTGSQSIWGADNGNFDRFQLLNFAGSPSISFGISTGTFATPVPGLNTTNRVVYNAEMRNNVAAGSTVQVNGVNQLIFTEITGDAASVFVIGAINNGDYFPNYCAPMRWQESLLIPFALTLSNRQLINRNIGNFTGAF